MFTRIQDEKTYYPSLSCVENCLSRTGLVYFCCLPPPPVLCSKPFYKLLIYICGYEKPRRLCRGSKLLITNNCYIIFPRLRSAKGISRTSLPLLLRHLEKSAIKQRSFSCPNLARNADLWFSQSSIKSSSAMSSISLSFICSYNSVQICWIHCLP